ncbi:hypothetical protein LNP26_20115 [Klebsiella variicola subsp. variicola]|nr:hypothetical protein [Klebsiella variicola subsp. variicola]
MANSHARDLAEQFALPLIRVGFPSSTGSVSFVASARVRRHARYAV